MVGGLRRNGESQKPWVPPGSTHPWLGKLTSQCPELRLFLSCIHLSSQVSPLSFWVTVALGVPRNLCAPGKASLSAWTRKLGRVWPSQGKVWGYQRLRGTRVPEDSHSRANVLSQFLDHGTRPANVSRSATLVLLPDEQKPLSSLPQCCQR